MTYEIKVSQFCSLSQEIKFQSWLASTEPALYDKLLVQVKSGIGCHANTRVMTDIQKELDKKGKLQDLVLFLRDNFPATLREITTKKAVEQTRTTILRSGKDMVVFRHYNCALLTFPQKLVMQNKDVGQLRRDVKHFLTDKINYDYIIVSILASVHLVKPEGIFIIAFFLSIQHVLHCF